jgi:hypothetical protein
MDVYTRNGNLIRQFPNDDGTTRVQLEFLDADRSWSRLFALATFYLAFRVRLRVDYVAANHTGTEVVVRQADFTPEVQQGLVAALLHVRDRSSAVRAIAQRVLFDQPPSGDPQTSALPELAAHAKSALPFAAFFTALAAEIGPGPAAAA